MSQRWRKVFLLITFSFFSVFFTSLFFKTDIFAADPPIDPSGATWAPQEGSLTIRQKDPGINNNLYVIESKFKWTDISGFNDPHLRYEHEITFYNWDLFECMTTNGKQDDFLTLIAVFTYPEEVDAARRGTVDCTDGSVKHNLDYIDTRFLDKDSDGKRFTVGLSNRPEIGKEYYVSFIVRKYDANGLSDIEVLPGLGHQAGAYEIEGDINNINQNKFCFIGSLVMDRHAACTFSSGINNPNPLIPRQQFSANFSGTVIYRWPENSDGGGGGGAGDDSCKSSDIDKSCEPSQPQPIPTASSCPSYSYNGVAFFDYTECVGTNKKEYNSEGFHDLWTEGFNDKASSVHIQPGWSVRVWSDISADGREGLGSSRCLSWSMWDLRKDYYHQGNTALTLNNNISAARVYRDGSCGNGNTGTTVNNGGDSNGKVEFYGNSEYSGNFWFSLGIGDSNQPEKGAHYKSLKIPSGWSIQLFDEDNQRGNNICFNQTQPLLENHGWHNRIASVKIASTDICPKSEAQGVLLFPETGYGGGGGFRVTQDLRSLGNAGFGNDRAQSIDIHDWHAVLYRDDDYQGDHVYLRGDVPNLDNTIIKNKQLSSIRVAKRYDEAFILHDLNNFNGEQFASDRTIEDYSHWNYNDTAESITVQPGYEVIVCQHAYFRGICGRTTESKADLNQVAQGLSGEVSSVQVCKGGCPVATSAPTQTFPIDQHRFEPESDITLSWSNSGREYYIELWGGDLAQTMTYGWTSNQNWQLNNLPTSENPYFWRIKSWSEFGEGAWSQNYSFYINAQPPEEVIIFGNSKVNLFEENEYFAYVSPIEATDLEYKWSPEPVSGQGTVSAKYIFDNIDEKTITLTVKNSGGQKSTTQNVVIGCKDGEFLTEYFDNKNLEGEPIYLECVSEIDKNWSGTEASTLEAEEVNKTSFNLQDNFSVRFTGSFITYDPGIHNIVIRADDGIRAWIDSNIVLDHWVNGYSENGRHVDIDFGLHTLVIEYYQDTDDAFIEAKLNKVVTQSLCSDVTIISKVECEALKSFYQSTNGDNWINRENWLTSKNPCDWYGITCSEGSVRELKLKANNLVGTIPFEIGNLINLQNLSLNENALIGQIPNSVTNLTSLKRLILNDNMLAGQIPESIGGMSNLEFLYLHNNSLSGVIPNRLGEMISLTRVGLQNNSFEGSIPSSIGNLTNLQNLNLSNSRLTGEIPSSITNLANLQVLNLHDNQFTGNIPSGIGDLEKLEILNLSDNKLEGSIPDSIGNLQMLKLLYLQSNKLEGTIPEVLGDLQNVKRILFQNNKLSGQIPTSLTNLINAETINLRYNMLETSNINLQIFLTLLDSRSLTTQTIAPENILVRSAGGVVEISWSRIPYTNHGGYYEVLYKTENEESYNSIACTTTSKSDSMCIVSNLPLDKTYNFVIRTFTPAHDGQSSDLLSSFSKTVKAEVSINLTDFCGNVLQISYTECEALVSLYNSTNGDSWTINTDWLQTYSPCSWYGLSCKNGNINKVNLVKNNLIGTIPTKIGNLAKLEVLSLRENQLTGQIPESIGKLVLLRTLQLNSNMLEGSIPSTIGDLVSLEFLNMQRNALSGEIPNEIGQLVNLEFMYLDKNNFQGKIPSELENLNNLVVMSLGNNQLNGNIPKSIINMPSIAILHINSNKLEGQIPESIGQLANLRSLYLQDNNLDGPIPESISNISGLETLYLQNNKLEGELPSNIQNLENLKVLFLQNNKLQGEIPEGLKELVSLEKINLDFNMLKSSNPEIIQFLSIKNPNWIKTQSAIQ